MDPVEPDEVDFDPDEEFTGVDDHSIDTPHDPLLRPTMSDATDSMERFMTSRGFVLVGDKNSPTSWWEHPLLRKSGARLFSKEANPGVFERLEKTQSWWADAHCGDFDGCEGHGSYPQAALLDLHKDLAGAISHRALELARTLNKANRIWLVARGFDLVEGSSPEMWTHPIFPFRAALEDVDSATWVLHEANPGDHLVFVDGQGYIIVEGESWEHLGSTTLTRSFDKILRDSLNADEAPSFAIIRACRRQLLDYGAETTPPGSSP